jgi:uncharacterized protein YqeY
VSTRFSPPRQFRLTAGFPAAAIPPDAGFSAAAIPPGQSRILESSLSVLDQVRADTVRAMKAGDKATVGALRLLTSELQKDAKEGAGDELAVLRRERKRRVDAAEQFASAGRTDLSTQETTEAELISGYLPPELDDDRLAEIVSVAVTESGATTVKDLGAVMKLVMARTQGQVEGKRAQTAVRKALS